MAKTKPAPETEKAPVVVPEKKNPPIWPIEYSQGESPVPILLVTGNTNSGKTTALASIAPAPVGSPPRMWVIDTERSWSDIAGKLAVIVSNVEPERFMTDYGQSLQLARWNAFVEIANEILSSIESGQVTGIQVIAIDTASDLRDGAREWLLNHPNHFQRDHKYRGEIGSMHSWSDASLLFEAVLLKMAQYVETVAVAMHRKKDFKSKTIKEDGFKIDRKVALQLTLYDQKDVEEARKAGIEPCRWALVEKQRLSYQSIDENGELHVGEMLPRKLIPQNGESFISLIRRYMRSPQADWGDLSRFEDEAGLNMQEDSSETDKQHDILLHQKKLELIRRLKDEGIISNPAEILEILQRADFYIHTLADVDQAELLVRQAKSA